MPCIITWNDGKTNDNSVNINATIIQSDTINYQKSNDESTVLPECKRKKNNSKTGREMLTKSSEWG